MDTRGGVMGFGRMLVWTVCSVGLGVALATVPVSGRTPLEHAKVWWTRADAGGWVKDRAEDAVDRAKGAVGQPVKPRERHSDEDRAALDRIIARRAVSR